MAGKVGRPRKNPLPEDTAVETNLVGKVVMMNLGSFDENDFGGSVKVPMVVTHQHSVDCVSGVRFTAYPEHMGSNAPSELYRSATRGDGAGHWKHLDEE